MLLLVITGTLCVSGEAADARKACSKPLWSQESDDCGGGSCAYGSDLGRVCCDPDEYAKYGIGMYA